MSKQFHNPNRKLQKEAKSTHKYMYVHFPGLVQALQWKVAGQNLHVKKALMRIPWLKQDMMDISKSYSHSSVMVGIVAIDRSFVIVFLFYFKFHKWCFYYVPCKWCFYYVPSKWCFYNVPSKWCFYHVPSEWCFYHVPSKWCFYYVPSKWYLICVLSIK